MDLLDISSVLTAIGILVSLVGYLEVRLKSIRNYISKKIDEFEKNMVFTREKTAIHGANLDSLSNSLARVENNMTRIENKIDSLILKIRKSE